MTTIACNLKEIAADTRVTWEGVGSDIYTGVKLFAGDQAIWGVTGENCTGSILAIEWLLAGAHKDYRPAPPEYEHDWSWKIIELSRQGIALFNEHMERELCAEAFLAVGSGRKVAMYCMKFLGMSPAEAVREACRVDHWSEVPIYSARLADMKVERWQPRRMKRKSKSTER